VLWRLAWYVAWEGEQDPTLPVLGTVVYLHPTCDMGDTLQQVIDGQVVQQWQLACVRLWQYAAADLLASGAVGLAVLSPLGQHPSADLVEQAVGVVQQQAPRPQQGDLLSILGVFAEPLMETERFKRLVGRERLMESKLFNDLFQERLEECVEERINERVNERVTAVQNELQARFQAEKAELERKIRDDEAKKAELERKIRDDEAEKAELETRSELQHTLVDALLTRFQQVPPAVLRDLWQVKRIRDLHTLIVGVVQAADVEEFAAMLKPLVPPPEQG
jgi:hypothetical protein